MYDIQVFSILIILIRKILSSIRYKFFVQIKYILVSCTKLLYHFNRIEVS
nr:MAG TPA: hypothetical protein [Caudoviricetes sp.]